MLKWARAASVGIGLAAASALIAMVAARPALAQTMGEYGMATGHAAASASQMPAIQAAAPSIGPSGSDGGGSTHMAEIRGYDDPAPAQDSQSKDDDAHDSAGTSQDWVQVK